ncbi:MAG: cyclic nucleotide-binding domain-containing protein [Bdellovibrionota bacterium]
MAETKKIPKDYYLFRDGDAPDAMYLIKSGSFAITKTKGSSEVTLAEIGPGAMVGEMALFDKKPRSANVKALKDSEVVALPYNALEAQLDTLPVWIRAIMKTLNENIREANKKIKSLESTNNEADRYSPHVVNKLISIINFVGLRYGQKEGNVLLVPQYRLRNTTIQIFQEATNKMQTMLSALEALGFMKVEELGEGKQKISNFQPELLFEFVDWYNDWLFKQEKEKVAVNAEEVKLLEGVLHFAKKGQTDAKGLKKINLNEMQNESMKELGFLIKVEELNGLIEKKFLSEKTTSDNAVFVTLKQEEVEPIAKYWKIIWDLKKLLK